VHAVRFLAVVVTACWLSSGPVGGTPNRITKPVSFAILEDYDKGHDLADIAQDFALFKELEITTWRGSFGWDDYEPSRGAYDFSWLRRFVELAGAHGITLRPYLGYTPEWAARPGGRDGDVWNNPPRDLDRFARFARELARELRRYPHVVSYEIYNEQNVTQWWDSDASTYAQLLSRAARDLRRADRDAQILFGGLVFPDADWIEAACADRSARDSFDVLPFHAYPETWTPPEVTVENYLNGLDGFVEAADSTCGRRPIWINETGFATVPGTSEREQATWWVRAIATFLAHPRVEHVGVYEIKDLARERPAIGDAPNYHLGLTRTDRSRKPAFATVDMLTDLLDTGTLHVLVEQLTVVAGEGSGTVFHHMFERPDGERVLIVWARAGPRRVTITLPEPHPPHITEYFLDLTTRRVESEYVQGRGELSLQLKTDEPRVFRLVR
jgi:hypothetical protein